MRNSIIRIMTMISVLFIFTSTSLSQPKFNREMRDSVSIGQYTAIIYEAISFNGEKMHEELLMRLGRSPSMSTMSKTVKIYNFNANSDDPKKAQYSKDLNKDGLEDIIVFGHTGLGTCCNHVSVHSLGEKAITDIGRFELKDADDIFLKDLDNDGLPEIMFYDANFAGWNAPFEESPMPLLIWKWNDGKYRLANHKFSKYLIKNISADDLKSLKKIIKTRADKEYDPQHEYYRYPPAKLWGLMLDYIYAGRPETADSLFYANWPEKIPNRKEFYDSFQDQLKKGVYWNDLGKSDF